MSIIKYTIPTRWVQFDPLEVFNELTDANYYYDEKNEYLRILGEVRSLNHDLTPFLKFGLRGIALQCRRLFEEFKVHLQRSLFKNTMDDLFGRLQSKRKRVIAKRQMIILNHLLDVDSMLLNTLYQKTSVSYRNLGNPWRAFIRDLNYLMELGAVSYKKQEKGYWFFVRLEWTSEITETKFFAQIQAMPKAKTMPFL